MHMDICTQPTLAVSLLDHLNHAFTTACMHVCTSLFTYLNSDKHGDS